MDKKTVNEIIHLIEELDAHEADAMGVSCQYFSRTVVDEIKKLQLADEALGLNDR
jgi:hypothetical protein